VPKNVTLSDPSLPEEVATEPSSDKGETNLPNDKGEEGREEDTWSAAQKGADKPNKETNTKKRSVDMDIDPCEPRRTRGIKKDYRYLHNPFPDKEEVGIACVNKDEAYVVVPDDKCRSLCQAKGSEDWEEWEHAMYTELDQLQRMGTWKLVEKPPGVVPIANKWVYAKKQDKEGIVTKYKARLVAKGCAQQPRHDYLETHSLVVRLDSIYVILTIAATRKLHMHQMDVKGTYLNSTLKERVYMKQPKGYNDGTGRVCLLIKTLYSLKQAGREWNIEFDSKLRKRGYQQLLSDPCVYIVRTREDFSIMTVWVDDILIFAMTIDLRDKTIADIEAEWEVTNISKPTKIVGIEITTTPDSIAILSRQYIESILQKEGMDSSDSVSTPLDPNVALVPNPKGENRSCSNSFARLLGELQYIANAMHPDITYAVNRLTSYMANPSLQHNIVVKQILRYLAGT